MLVGLAAVALLAAPGPAQAACDHLLAPRVMAARGARGVTAEDLLGLRRIGPADALDTSARPLAVSPDAMRVAFVIARNDPHEGYCQALLVINRTRGARPAVLDQGGDRILQHFALRGAEVTAGLPAVITPRWSPDGSKIGYLKKIGGAVRLWIVDARGHHAHPVSAPAIDVDDWMWSADGQSLIYTAQPGRRVEAARLAIEGRRGYLFDRRFWPGMAAQPMPAGDMPEQTFVIDRAGVIHRADPAQVSAMAAASAIGPAGVHGALDRRGWRADVVSVDSSPLSANRIEVHGPNGAVYGCADERCRGAIIALWWVKGALLFERHEGWDREATALYRWIPGSKRPQRILRTNDVLLGCVLATQLICTDEASARPRRIVSIDIRSGAILTLFDPNPAFVTIRLGRVERLHTINAEGLKAWTDLVLPPDYRAGTILPTIVVQYHSRGFLLGGTGNDYPIFLFAQAGYAVLSIEEPRYAGYVGSTLATWDQINAAAAHDWREQRSVWSSLEQGLDAAIARGVVDPSRVGITGLSAGAATVQFALINSHRFAAAAISTCCLEPETVMTQGIAWADWNHEVMGYPSLIHPDPAYWAPMSLRDNATQIKTPLLLQLADTEYLQSLEAFSALREAGAPLEMYIFPHEDHTKIDPLHRLAVWMRSLDWFNFWLRQSIDVDPAKAAQYARWQALRQAQPTSHVGQARAQASTSSSVSMRTKVRS